MKFMLLSWMSGLVDALSPKPMSKSHLTKDHLMIAKRCRDVYSKDVEALEIFVESKDTGVQATVDIDGSRAIVCVRGSDERVNWKYNFKMGKVPFLTRNHKNPENKVHSGFFIGHTSIKGKIYKKLNAIVDSGECDRILFCGHSAGTIASLLAYDYLNRKNLPIEVVTFGSPRICNKEFADEFNEKMECTRVINDRDVIPLAPLRAMGFHHVGRTLIHIKNSNSTSEDHSTIRKIGWRLRGLIGLDAGVRDHFMDSYVEEIQKCLEN